MLVSTKTRKCLPFFTVRLCVGGAKSFSISKLSKGVAIYNELPIPEFEKTIVFYSCFLKNLENFLNFAKSLKKLVNL